jgi:hypothetical protein
MDPCCDPEVRHEGQCRLTMFAKQVSRPVDGLDPPSRPTRPKRVERTRRETWSRALSEVLVPFTILRTHWSRCRSMVSVPFRQVERTRRRTWSRARSEVFVPFRHHPDPDLPRRAVLRRSLLAANPSPRSRSEGLSAVRECRSRAVPTVTWPRSIQLSTPGHLARGTRASDSPTSTGARA